MIEQRDSEEFRQNRVSYLQSELDQCGSYQPTSEWDAGKDSEHARRAWKEMVWPGSPAAVYDPQTGIDEHMLRQVGTASVEIPKDFVRTSSSSADLRSRKIRPCTID